MSAPPKPNTQTKWIVGPHTSVVTYRDLSDEGSCGECSNADMSVDIDLNLTETRRVEVEIHELLHLLIADADIRSEELLVVNLSRGLSQFFLDNPKVVDNWVTHLRKKANVQLFPDDKLPSGMCREGDV